MTNANDTDAAEQEALCRRCGRCCHQKIRFGEIVVITDVACDFLDIKTKNCTVYPQRFIKQPLCTTAKASADMGALPADCPYVDGRNNYPAPVLLADHLEYEQAVNTIFPQRVAIHPVKTKSKIKAKKYGRS